MQLTLCDQTALHILRSMRAGVLEGWSGRCDVLAPDASDAANAGTATRSRWSRKKLEALLQELDFASAEVSERLIHVACPNDRSRIGTKGVRNTVYAEGLPKDAFLSLGNGIAISSPELLFVELAATMDPVVHLLLGLELTGSSSRCAADPKDGHVTYNAKPVTSIAKLKAFVWQAKGIHGLRQAQKTLELLPDNAWSPMEAIVAALLVLPVSELGYDLGPIDLNVRKTLANGSPRITRASSRVPDILIRGSKVGVNYDGEDHFKLRALAEAGRAAGARAGDERAEAALEKALLAARKSIVGDKQRDRDLRALGLTALPVTKEDLYERGGLDLLVSQLAQLLREQGRNTTELDAALADHELAARRQELISSLLPQR